MHCWWECRLVRPLWKAVWNFLRKLEMELPFDPEIPLLALYPQSPETPSKTNYASQYFCCCCCYSITVVCLFSPSLHPSIPVFTVAQFTIAKQWKQPKCPSANEWIKKLWCIYTMEFYVAERKKELHPLGQHGWNWRALC